MKARVASRGPGGLTVGLTVAGLGILAAGAALVALTGGREGGAPPSRGDVSAVALEGQEQGASPGVVSLPSLLSPPEAPVVDTPADLIRRCTDARSSLRDRQVALAEIDRHPDRRFRIAALSAVAADGSTPPERDHLWTTLVDALARATRGGLEDLALDQMLSEARPRARRAIVSALVQLVEADRGQGLNATQRFTLSNTLIDLYRQAPAAQQSEIQRGLRALGDEDAADVLLGKGLDSDNLLQGQRVYEGALRAAAQSAPSAL